MKLDKLQYQLDAIEKAVAAIDKSDITENANFYANPILQRTRNIDIKMETGTGKTYVYTRLMHQLRQTLGFFKFIIMVPSVAIKEGVKMSIQSDDWNKHFRLEFGNQSISLGAINAGDFSSKKGKRKQIPEALRSFCDSSRAEEKTLSVLLLNDAMLASSSMSSSDYDSTLFGSIGCPLEGLEATRPIVIIDEPHRFRKEGKAWENINKLSPQLIIRFGATFPEIKNGKGKSKTKKIDYENLVYDLNSVRAFNEGLVKGVHIQYPAVVSADDNMIKCKVKSINKNGNKLRSVTFSINNRDTEVPFGGNLSAVDENFGDITLELDGKNIVLSSGTLIEAGMLILPQIYSMSYQEILLKQALDIHFEKEEQNFFRPNNAPKIKTNSLFFIDSISSFRGDNKTGWLRAKFEELLQVKINMVLAKIAGQARYDEYGDFLRYSLQNIKKCLAGYFAQDNGDQSVQEEIDLVLRDKEQSLRFRNKNGEWNVCRFFFSKWTLCEGWDNPNVFVITKLRSSGSENRKIQEVGRGLRLPFDESGRRIADEKFYLSYIIDYSERAFAKKLVGEINNDGGLAMDNIITEELIDILVASGYATAAIPAQMKLLSDGIINENRELLDAEKLRELLPESERDRISKAGNVLSEGAPQQPKIKLNRDNFEKLRDLWQEVTKRYLLRFEKIEKHELEKLLRSMIRTHSFVAPYAQIVKQRIARGENTVQLLTDCSESVDSSLSVISYGEFLKRLNKRTSLPLTLLHSSMIDALKDKKNTKDLFNLKSLENLINAFDEKFADCFAQKYDYRKLDFCANTSLIKDDNFVDELTQGVLGNDLDSNTEHEVLKLCPQTEVVVYDKLPKSSIKVPTYTGKTTTPDFVFAISKDSGKTLSLCLVIETKSDNLRFSDAIALNAQEKLFTQIPNVVWRKETSVESFERHLKQLVQIA